MLIKYWLFTCNGFIALKETVTSVVSTQIAEERLQHDNEFHQNVTVQIKQPITLKLTIYTIVIIKII